MARVQAVMRWTAAKVRAMEKQIELLQWQVMTLQSQVTPETKVFPVNQAQWDHRGHVVDQAKLVNGAKRDLLAMLFLRMATNTKK